MNTRVLFIYLLLAVSLFLLAAAVYLIINPDTGNVIIHHYPTNITTWLSGNISVNNTTGVVRLGY